MLRRPAPNCSGCAAAGRRCSGRTAGPPASRGWPPRSPRSARPSAPAAPRCGLRARAQALCAIRTHPAVHARLPLAAWRLQAQPRRNCQGGRQYQTCRRTAWRARAGPAPGCGGDGVSPARPACAGRGRGAPEGSPTRPVAPPSSATGVCPQRRNQVSTTRPSRWPRCRLSAVGSKPQYTCAAAAAQVTWLLPLQRKCPLYSLLLPPSSQRPRRARHPAARAHCTAQALQGARPPGLEWPLERARRRGRASQACPHQTGQWAAQV